MTLDTNRTNGDRCDGLVIELDEPVPLRGHVRDRGQPIEGVTVVAMDPATPAVLTNDRGEFEVLGIGRMQFLTGVLLVLEHVGYRAVGA